MGLIVVGWLVGWFYLTLLSWLAGIPNPSISHCLTVTDNRRNCCHKKKPASCWCCYCCCIYCRGLPCYKIVDSWLWLWLFKVIINVVIVVFIFENITGNVGGLFSFFVTTTMMMLVLLLMLVVVLITVTFRPSTFFGFSIFLTFLFICALAFRFLAIQTFV